MKRILATLALAASLAAPAAAQQKTIGVALASDTNPFYVAMKRGIEAKAKELGYATVFVTANEQIAAQVNGINDLIARKVDGILASPIDARAVNGAYEAAAKAKIPIISIARHADSPNQTMFVSMDEKLMGREIGAWLAQRIGGKGKIAMIAGPQGAATFRNLAEGFEEAIKGHKDIQIVYKKEVALTRENGLKQGEDVLVAHPDVVGIYGGQDDIALGAAQAVAAAGKKGKIAITGLNGIPPAIRAVKAGDIGMTMALNPVAWGQLGVETMDGYLKGRIPAGTKLVNVKHLLVDSRNVDEVLARMAPPPAKQ
jgi:ribose transport system substrate-binding protein